MAHTHLAQAAHSRSQLSEAYQHYPATEGLTYMDVAARGLISQHGQIAALLRSEPEVHTTMSFVLVRHNRFAFFGGARVAAGAKGASRERVWRRARHRS